MDFNPASMLSCLNADLVHQARPLGEDSPRNKAAGHLVANLFKKFMHSDSTEHLDSVTISKFIEMNNRCLSAFAPTSADVVDVFRRARDSLFRTFHHLPGQDTTFTLENAFLLGRHGPGKSASVRSTDFLGKMWEDTLTTYDQYLLGHFETQLRDRWLAAYKLRSTRCHVTVLGGSRLTTVPKNVETNRTICTEASLNMFYQLGAGSIIEGMLKRVHNIDLSKQPDVNRELAREGSVTGKFATIDLSSASDTISLKLCSALLPRQAYGILKALRAPNTTLPDGEVVELHMMSSMGNGFTFPLQTLVFASLVRACYEHLDIKPHVHSRRNYSVFGDDIICLEEAYDLVTRVLSECGFIVNVLKSYNEGPFRESCGHDYYSGINIRSVYIRKCRTPQDLYSALNRLMRWSARHCISIDRTLNYLYERLPKSRILFVPLHEGDDSGLKVPMSCLPNVRLDRNGSMIYRSYSSKPFYRKIEVDDFPGCNYHGRLIAFLGGYIREHRITNRVKQVRYKVVRSVTPNWDYSSDPDLTSREYVRICFLLTYPL